MKRLVTIITVLLILILGNNIKLSGSSFTNQDLYEKGLGKTINVVTATYANPKNYFNGSSIFDMDVFNSLNLVHQEIKRMNCIGLKGYR
jgi:hypothetical protein